MKRGRLRAILGVDVGATTIAAGLVTHAGDVVHSTRRPTHVNGTGTGVKTLLEMIENLWGEAERRDITLDGVGVGLPGVIDPATRMMLDADVNRVREFADVPVAEEIRRVTGLPVVVDNDGNAHVLAEWIFGVGRGARSIVLIAVGTATGGGIIIDGQLVRGSNGHAAELHYLTVDFQGEHCYCGARGCFGSYVGGYPMAWQARRRIERGEHTAALELAGGDPEALTSVHVFQAADAGDATARSIVERACDALGAGIASMISTLNPDVIVITGGLAPSLAPHAARIRGRAAESALPRAFAATRIELVNRSKDETVRAGAALVLHAGGATGFPER
jgi:glucokinase